MTIYFDSVIPIYLLDHAGSFQARALNRLLTLESAGDSIIVSDLVRLECRVRPIRLGDTVSLGNFDTFFARPDVICLELPRKVFDRATLLRGTYNFRLGDSLHLASAIEAGCDRFLTNDNRLSKCTDIAIEILS